MREATLLFDMLFEGRRDVYAIQKSNGGIECIHSERGIIEMEKHLGGEQALAVYPVCEESCWFACLDADCADNPEEAIKTAKEIQQVLKKVNIETWLEKSKSKGAHLWVFFTDAVPASLAQALIGAALKATRVVPMTKVLVEIFPKQVKVPAGKTGNCINLPYFPPLVAEGKCVVLDPENEQPLSAGDFAYCAYESRASSLENIKTAFGMLLDMAEPKSEPGKTTDSLPDTLPETLMEEIVKTLTPYWQRGIRNFLTLGVAGLLARKGFSRQTAEQVVREVCRAAEDEEERTRMRVVADTYEKFSSGEKIAGYSHLAPHLPEDVLQNLYETLQLAEKERRAKIADTQTMSLTEEALLPAFTLKPPVEGLFKEVCDYYTLSTDANLEIRCAAGLILLSLLVGRTLRLQEGKRKTYPNLWVLIIGPSSDTRKSTLQFLTENLWERVLKDPKVKEHVLRSPTEPKETPFRDEELEIGRTFGENAIWSDDFSPEALSHKLALISTVYDECRFAIFTDEAGHYLAALEKKDYLATAAGKMLSLYDCPRRRLMERRQAGKLVVYEARNLFMNWFLVTTPVALLKASVEQLKYTGFFQRCLFVPTGPREKEPEDFQTVVQDEDIEDLVAKLRRLALISSLSPDKIRDVEFTEEAKEKFREFVSEIRAFRRENPNLLEAELLARLDTHTKKLAMLMQACIEAEKAEIENTGFLFGETEDPVLMVTEEAVQRAVGLIRYFWRATEFTATNLLHTSEFMEKRQRIIDALQRVGGTASRRKTLQATRMSLKEFQEVIDTMVARGELEIEQPLKSKKRGRKPSPHLSLISNPGIVEGDDC